MDSTLEDRVSGQEIELIIDRDGYKEFRLKSNHNLHNTNGPAIVYPDGSNWFYRDGKLHNLKGPAANWSNGSKEYWVNGRLHRRNEPAVNWPSGTEWIYQYGRLVDLTLEKLIAKGEKPVAKIQGVQAHWINGKQHNPNGPAVIWEDGTVEHWFNGKLHNTTGPAIICPDGYTEFWVTGQQLSKRQFNLRFRSPLSPLYNMAVESHWANVQA